jgi:hypothetical protein
MYVSYKLMKRIHIRILRISKGVDDATVPLPRECMKTCQVVISRKSQNELVSLPRIRESQDETSILA